jgi:hypothetical protein
MLTKIEREMSMSAFHYYMAGKYAAMCRQCMLEARDKSLKMHIATSVKYARLYNRRKLHYVQLAKSE